MNGSGELIGSKGWEVAIQVWGNLIRIPEGIFKEKLITRTRRGFIYPLPRLTHEEGMFFTLREEFKITSDYRLVIRCFEEGGGFIHSGRAIVICGCHGEQMLSHHPSSIEQLDTRNNAHAFFSLERLVSVTAERKADSKIFVSIAKHFAVAASEKGDSAFRIATKLLWEGDPENLPEFRCVGQAKLGEVRQAIAAAIEKTNHFQCHESHFSRAS